MKLDLTVLAKSDKHTGYCVAAIDRKGKTIRLVRDEEGHALSEEQCKFKKLNHILVDATHTPLNHQRENYMLNELLSSVKTSTSINDLKRYLNTPSSIFDNTNPYLSEDEMHNKKSTFLFVEIEDLHVHLNDEEKYKADFTYKNQKYEGFSITDPEYKIKARKISKAIILISLPNAPYSRYGHNLYYKFICAVYPINPQKSYEFDCYKI